MLEHTPERRIQCEELKILQSQFFLLLLPTKSFMFILDMIESPWGLKTTRRPI